jgi:serine protease Do
MESDKKSEKNERVPVSYKAVTRRSGSKTGKYAAAVIILLAGCFTAGLGGGYVANHFGNSSTIIDRNSAGDGNAVVSKEEEDISTVASHVGPSVVSILTKGQTQSFFGPQTQEGAGSGIIISADGYILTNKHVVDNSNELAVVGSDGTVYDDVTIIGTDPLNDLAFIKIKNVSNLHPASLGDSSSVRIGQKVVAIGNSLGEYQNTVTSGIISGTGRPVSAQEGNSVENLTDLIQTDAAINPGNSGGPLTNLSGQIIGINTAIAQDAQSIGFSIPINSAKGIIKNLLKTGKIERPYVGVNYVSITPEIAKQNNLPVKKGAYVTSDNGPSVISGSPADKAGIKSKDIIVKVGDLEVGERGSVSSLISEYAVGDKVDISILRDGKAMTVTVTLQAYTASGS